jgi:hypothetical protein
MLNEDPDTPRFVPPSKRYGPDAEYIFELVMADELFERPDEHPFVSMTDAPEEIVVEDAPDALWSIIHYDIEAIVEASELSRERTLRALCTLFHNNVLDPPESLV